jgi:polar amino acid transport system substrate-binding protein
MIKSLFSFLLLILILTSCGQQDTTKLRIGMDVGYPPMEMVDTDGKTAIGFDVDVGKEIAKRMNKKDIEIVSTSWDAIFVALETNKFDCIISSVSLTPERENKFAMTSSYVANKQVLVTKKDESNVKSPEDLAGKVSGVQVSTTAEDFLKKLISEGKSIKYNSYQKITQAFMDLKIGRIQGVVVDIVVAKYYLMQDKESFQITWESPESEPLGIVYSKKNAVLRDQTNSILSEMQKDGTMEKISEKWFGANLSK